MITAGVDIGAKTIKIVLVKDSQPVAQEVAPAGLDAGPVLVETFTRALAAADGVSRDDLACIAATGSGRQVVDFANEMVTEVSAAARGAFHLFSSARTVIDVGAEEGRAIRCTENGKVEDFAVNEKCAAGAGTFTESMARALGVDIKELGQMSLRAKQAVAMNAQCTVFAESEVVSLLHAKTPKEDISRAVHDAMASRITSMVRKVGFRKELVAIGGMALNAGFLDSLRRGLETDVLVPEQPVFTGALGAALIAADRAADKA